MSLRFTASDAAALARAEAGLALPQLFTLKAYTIAYLRQDQEYATAGVMSLRATSPDDAVTMARRVHKDITHMDITAHREPS